MGFAYLQRDNPKSRRGKVNDGKRTEMFSLKQAVNVEMVNCDHADPPVNDRGHGEDCSTSQRISSGVLLCIVKFIGQIRSVVGRQRMVLLGVFHRPDDAPGRAVAKPPGSVHDLCPSLKIVFDTEVAELRVRELVPRRLPPPSRYKRNRSRGRVPDAKRVVDVQPVAGFRIDVISAESDYCPKLKFPRRSRPAGRSSFLLPPVNADAGCLVGSNIPSGSEVQVA